MTKREKYSWIYWLAVIMFFLSFQMLFFPDSPANKELSYSSFLDSLKESKIERLVIFENRIIGQFKEEEDSVVQDQDMTEAPTTPWRLRIPSIEEQVNRQFIVSRLPDVEDDELLKKLEEADVEYKGQFEDNTLTHIAG